MVAEGSKQKDNINQNVREQTETHGKDPMAVHQTHVSFPPAPALAHQMLLAAKASLLGEGALSLPAGSYRLDPNWW